MSKPKYTITDEQRKKIVNKLYEYQTNLERLASLKMSIHVFNSGDEQIVSKSKVELLNQIITIEVNDILNTSFTDRLSLDNSFPSFNIPILNVIRENRLYLYRQPDMSEYFPDNFEIETEDGSNKTEIPIEYVANYVNISHFNLKIKEQEENTIIAKIQEHWIVFISYNDESANFALYCFYCHDSIDISKSNFTESEILKCNSCKKPLAIITKSMKPNQQKAEILRLTEPKPITISETKVSAIGLTYDEFRKARDDSHKTHDQRLCDSTENTCKGYSQNICDCRCPKCKDNYPTCPYSNLHKPS